MHAYAPYRVHYETKGHNTHCLNHFALPLHILVKDVVINWYVEKLVPIFPWALRIACNAKFLFTTNFTRENMLITRYVLWLVETSICRGDMISSTELFILIVAILQDFFTIHQMVKWEYLIRKATENGGTFLRQIPVVRRLDTQRQSTFWKRGKKKLEAHTIAV